MFSIIFAADSEDNKNVMIRWAVVSPTNRFTNVLCRSAKKRMTSSAHVYASFSQGWYKKVRHAFIYIILSAANQAKAVGELSTQHVREKTSDVSQQGGELLKAWLALTIG